MTLKQRLWKYIVKSDLHSCWEWKGIKNQHGYGLISIDSRRIVDGVRVPESQRARKGIASRLVYEFEVGPIPDRMVVMHICDNPPCCNPSHLRLGTQRENVLDSVHKGRWNPTHGAPPGERNPGAKLTEKQALEIIAGYKSGVNQRTLAERYGVSQVNVQRICTGKRWPHLQRE